MPLVQELPVETPAEEEAVEAEAEIPAALAQAQPLITPLAAQKATHFFGPVVSGGPNYVQGQAVLAYRFDVSYLTPAFTGATPGAKLIFPPGTMLGKIQANVRTAYTVAGTALKIGTTTNGSEIASVLLTGLGFLEVSPSIAIPANGIVYLSLDPGASTAGAAAIAIGYIGAPAAKWS